MATRVDRAAWFCRLATFALLIALLSPMLRNEDGLPLSTYPMYSSARSEVTAFVTASAVDEQGSRATLSALVISGSRDRLIAQAFLNDAVRRGDAAEVCAEIADRFESRGREKIEIATERHNTIARLRGDESLEQREVHVVCEVGR